MSFVFKAGMRLWGGILKAGMRLHGRQFSGWDGTIWVAVLRIGCDYLGGSFKAGVQGALI